MLKIRRSRDRLIFNMGVPIPGKDGLYIDTDTFYMHDDMQKAFPITDPLWEEPPVTGGFPSQRASNGELWSFLYSWGETWTYVETGLLKKKQ